MKTLYLAGPDVFAPRASELGAAKKAVCARHGLLAVFPMDLVPFDPAVSREVFGLAVFDSLEAAMRRCVGVVANLTPFHGLSMDVGSAFEMGFARALGKPIFGYTNADAPLADRARRLWRGVVPDEAGSLRDPEHGMEVDSLGTVDNLMLDACIARSTGILVVGDVAPAALFSDLGPFEECVAAAAEWLKAR